MEDSDLSDTRVNLLEGSVVVQAQQLLSGNTVNLLHESSQVRASAQSLYRFDLSPARLNVLAGDANITIGAEGLIVEGPRSLDLKSGVVSPLSVSKPDAFDNWVRERRKLIANETRQAEAGLSKKHRHSIAWPFPAAGAPLPSRTW